MSEIDDIAETVDQRQAARQHDEQRGKRKRVRDEQGNHVGSLRLSCSR